VAINVRVDVSGDDLKEIPQRIRSIVAPRFMEVSTDFLQSRMITYAPYKSGELVGSITTKRWGNQYGYFAQVGPTAPHTPFVVLGTAPHDIYPVNARVLHWLSSGGDIFATHVRHPGTRPNPFMDRTQADYEESVDDLWGVAWEEEFRK
jgi:hypothetical protein